jgi:DNA-binding IclR family transcriptional regulator
VIQTVTNALRVLEAFRESESEELGVTELSRLLSLHKNNVFRLLATLEERGYVEQMENSERYRLGVACQDLGHSFARRRDLARHGRQVLEALSVATGESAHLGALLDLEVTHLDGEQPDQLVLSRLRVGQRMPLHCTALGKVLLAAAGPDAWDRFEREFAPKGELPSHTATTIIDRDKFLDHLQSVAGEGFALDLEECAAGLSCAAAPVLDASGRTIAALSISAPSYRVPEEILRQELLRQVIQAADQLSARLGYHG